MNVFASHLLPRRRYDDLSVSIREHLEERVDELMHDGMSREEAEQRARREFGNARCSSSAAAKSGSGRR